MKQFIIMAALLLGVVCGRAEAKGSSHPKKPPEEQDSSVQTGIVTPDIATGVWRVNARWTNGADLTILVCPNNVGIEWLSSNRTWVCGGDANNGWKPIHLSLPANKTYVGFRMTKDWLEIYFK